MKVVALLPMKANSERVPNKNFRDFCGKPLFRWVLDTLLSVEALDQVVINTDAREKLETLGCIDSDRVLIRDRPINICGDFVSMNEVIRDDLGQVDADLYLQTHTTNPLLQRSSIEMAIKQYTLKLTTGECDSLFSVTKLQERLYDIDVRPVNHDPKNLLRTQDLPPLFLENSNFYLFSKLSFSLTNARIGARPSLFETKPYESTDIDTPDDWAMGEIVVEYLRAKGVVK